MIVGLTRYPLLVYCHHGHQLCTTNWGTAFLAILLGLTSSIFLACLILLAKLVK